MTSTNSFDPSKDVTFLDLTFYPDFFSCRLKHSKAGGPCTIIVARTDSQFKSMGKYLKKKHASL